MKCEEIEKGIIAYMDGRADSGERRDVEEHLAGCASCRTRLEEFRKVWSALDEVPAVEPTFGFDARVRQRVSAEPPRRWFELLVPQPRLAFSAVLLLALTLWIAKLPPSHPGMVSTASATQQEDFNAIKDLGVLENYDVLTKFDALSELPAAPAPKPTDGTSND
ncbi:MAG TPA: zf-HC2 domain-containing protein [Candidatus Acidoferrales bacterium]|nr:zf-HC2 domain-containing protein [Candidatus Acidoferrales bacterium]